MYRVADLEGQLRNTIVGRMTDMFGNSSIDFLDMAGNQTRLGLAMLEALRPVFSDLGLPLDSFTVESISLPEELQKMLDQRIGMNMLGDMGRYTQFQVAQSMPIAAANEGGGGIAARDGLRRRPRDGPADERMPSTRLSLRNVLVQSGGPSAARQLEHPQQVRNSASTAANRCREPRNSVRSAGPVSNSFYVRKAFCSLLQHRAQRSPASMLQDPPAFPGAL